MNRNLQLAPTTIHIDFEMAVIQAIRAEFAIEPSGCLFHFCQSILRHLQQAGHGLQVAYNTNIPPEVRTWIRRNIALPLVPPLRIDQAFQATVANAPNVPGKDIMNDYVLNTQVDPNTAMFPCVMWNCYGAHDRTINAREGYHSLLTSHFKHHAPDPYAFIAFLQQQDMELERRIGQLQVGAPPKRRKTKYVLVDEAIERLRDQYFTVGIPNVARLLQYMDAVAHQLYDVKH